MRGEGVDAAGGERHDERGEERAQEIAGVVEPEGAMRATAMRFKSAVSAKHTSVPMGAPWILTEGRATRL